MSRRVRWLAVMVAWGVAGVASAGKPNVVFILADDLGYADLGCTGAKDIRTPHIDGLARAGVRLTQAYSAACVCSPTRAALITGRYPQKTGFDWVIRYTEKERGLPAGEGGLARWLKEAGYATGLVGKWHLGYRPEFRPQAHGFDRFFGFLAADLDFYAHKDALGDPGLYENNQLVERPGYLTDLIADHAESFISDHREKPFFLSVCFNAPHWPFQKPGDPADIRDQTSYGPERGSRAAYVAMVERMDQATGRILAALDRHQLSQNTIVIFTSDNGGERLSDNGPYFHGKYTLWEGGLRVPAVVRWPGVVSAGSTCDHVNITMDWTATILAAIGAKADRPLDGEDLRPALAGRKPHDRTLCWRLPRPDAKYGMKAVRQGNWKLVYDREMELLFDVAADPGERRNLAWREPAKVAEMRQRLAEWDKGLPAPK